MKNVNESHDKPVTPSTNVETPLPSLQTKLENENIIEIFDEYDK
jgi:hypothetical protein